jgi:chromosome partitioning protein
MGQLLSVARQLKQQSNPELRIAGVLFTMCPVETDGRNACAEEMLASFQSNLFRTTIPWDGLLRESSDFGRPLVLHDITARGARAYLQLAMELVQFFESRKSAAASLAARGQTGTGGGI